MPAGRHRSFDKEEALEIAMHLFWRNGYENTSLTDLTQSMGINKPSLYAAFGNKEQLFMSALEKYAYHRVLPTLSHLVAPNQTLRLRLHTYFQSVAKLFCQPSMPTGCLVVNSTCEFAGNGMPETAQGLLSELNQKTRQQLTDFFMQEQMDGNLKTESSPRTLALYLMSINSGLAVLARNNTSLDDLDAVVEHAVQTIA